MKPAPLKIIVNILYCHTIFIIYKDFKISTGSTWHSLKIAFRFSKIPANSVLFCCTLGEEDVKSWLYNDSEAEM